MPVSRPNRKLTEFFSRKSKTEPKTGPRPGQPVYDISSSSDRAIKHVPSGDASLTKASSQRAKNSRDFTRVPTQAAASSRQAGDTRSAALYVFSSPETSNALSPQDHTPPSSPGRSRTRGNIRLDKDSPVSKSSSKQNCPAMPRNQGKKRKQPPISIISSEESDDPVLPVIHVKPSSRCNASPKRPLSQRQNTLEPSKHPSDGSDAKLLLLVSPTKKPENHCRPSPPKRARLGLLSTPLSSAPDDADDEAEGEDELTVPPGRQSLHARPKVAQPSNDSHKVLDVPAVSSPQFFPDKAGQGGHKDAPDGTPSRRTTPCEDAQGILPSSQQDEVELAIDHSVMDMDVVNPREHSPPVSPSKRRAEGIIALIKAKAEAEADAEVQLEHKRLIGLRDSGDDLSDLSSLSSLSDDDDEELQFNLRTFDNGTTGAPPRVNSPPGINGTRRSIRTQNIPAPNYAKKLELFRDDISPPPKQKEKGGSGRKVKDQSGTAFSCPLDVLLRDHEREDARQATLEKKRKVHPWSVRSPSPVASTSHSTVFETPSRPRLHADTESPGSNFSPYAQHVMNDSLMGDAEREELLGKEDADAVGKILAGDRIKDRERKRKEKEKGVALWDTDRQPHEDIVPKLVVSNGMVLDTLCEKLNRGEYESASLFINSRILATVPITVQLLEWLFSTAMSTASPVLSMAAYRSLIALQRESTTITVQIGSKALLASLFKFGMNPHISALLGAQTEEKTAVQASLDAKSLAISRFVIMLEAFGRSGAVESDAMPSAILCLLFIALDPSANTELQHDVVRAIESLLGSPMITPAAELNICKCIVHATASLSFTPQRETRLLSLLSGCGPGSGRVQRWTAWAMLGGDLSAVQKCEQIPPLDVLANLFTDVPAGNVRLEVDRETDYEILGARVEALSVALTDVDAYVRLEQSAHGSGGGNSRGIDGICKALELMNGKIVDTRAAHLDRTRTKEAINGLHKRLLYQRHATLGQIRGSAGNMDRFITKRGLDNKSKPKPKPVMAGLSN